MIDVDVKNSEPKDLEEAAKQLAAKQFGEAVLKRLKELKWTQQNLADTIFTGQPVISEITRGVYENLTLDWVSRLAKALKMPPSDLAKAYFFEEDQEAMDEEKTVLEKIRELMTEHYNIGGNLPQENEPTSTTPQQPEKPTPKIPTSRRPHPLSESDKTNLKNLNQSRRRAKGKDKETQENQSNNSEESDNSF